MKKNILKLLAIVVCILTLSACNKENNIIAGEWYYINDAALIGSEGNQISCTIEQTCTFKGNGTYITETSLVDNNLIDDLVGMPNHTTTTQTGKYNVSDGILTIKGVLLPTNIDGSIIMSKPLSAQLRGAQIECVSVDGTIYMYNKK